MGSSFKNLHIRANPENIDSISETIKQFYYTNGFIDGKNKKDSDHTIAIIAEDGNQWISCYRNDKDAGFGPDLDLLSLISYAYSCYAVGVFVYDSDYILLLLYYKGKMIDSFSNDKYFWGPDYEGYGCCEGDSKKWECISKNKEKLDDIWKKKKVVFVEDEILRPVADLIGLNYKKCVYNHSDLAKKQDAKFLYFQRKKTKQYDLRLNGLPVLYKGACTPKVTLSNEYPVLLYQSFLSGGGEVNGFDIRIFGEAIDNQVIEINKISITVNKSGKETEIQKDFVVQTFNNQKVIIADCSEIFIPAGLVYSMNECFSEFKSKWKKAWDETQVYVMIIGSVLKYNESQIIVAFVPKENVTQGYCLNEVDLVLDVRGSIPWHPSK